MIPNSGTDLPTRSEIEGWINDINDLSSAATQYRAAAERLESAADGHVQQLSAPGGTEWEGHAADAARESGYADRGVVYRAASHMREMAKVADLGSGNLYQVRNRVLDAISEAEHNDFQVGDDLTVTDTRRYTSREMNLYLERRAKADEHHADITKWAGILASEDAQVGAKLQAGTAVLNGMIPQDWNAEDDAIRAVDFPQGEPVPVDPLEEILKKYQVSEDPDGAVDWEPSWPFNMFTDPKHVTASEARILEKLSPFELQDMDQIKEAAEVEAKVRFPPQNGPNDTADNHTDAFRHAYWNALMTQRFGENWTRDFTNAHERLPNNPAVAEAMDLYNNEVGRNIAAANPNATPAQLADLVEQAVRSGDTVVIAPSGDKLAWSNTVPLGDAGTTTKTSVPGQVPIPTGTGPGGIYDPGQPGGYGTSAGGY